MTSPNPEDAVFTIAPGVLEDARLVAREMLARGETLRPYPAEGQPLFTITTDRASLDHVIVQIEVDETPIFIGRISDAQSVLPNNA